MRRAREAYEAERQAAVKAAAPPAPAEPTPAPAEPEAAPAPVEPGPALAALAPGPAAEPEPSGDALAASSLAPAPRAQLREVGFRQLPGVSRVYVRTSVTPRFSVEDAGENVVRVELENTRAARRNDTRFLDTSFFPSAVAMVTPMRRGSSYVVEIRLRERVPYQQRIEGDMLALDFARPASAGAAPADGAGDPLPAGAAPEAAPGGDAPPAPVPTPGR